MMHCDTVIRNARVLDGTGAEAVLADVAVQHERIVATGPALPHTGAREYDAQGWVLAPGFIDTHTHDDLAVIAAPAMLPKISQGVTTVIVGNCGISAAPVALRGSLPDPMNLLGETAAFCYSTFAEYVEAVHRARPAVNVAALVGHTALRSNHLDRLDRTATAQEIAAMQAQLREALAAGALGLSTGLAYLSAIAATTDEVVQLAAPLAAAGALYTTHLRSETEAIRDAMREACAIGKLADAAVVISHLKCAGIANWGRSAEVLAALDDAGRQQPLGWDCYPYAAGSSTLDLRQVDPRVSITITWSQPHPEVAGKTLAAIADAWQLDQSAAALRLQPAGAIYHSIDEQDMQRILAHPATMIGSDGLPNDPRPHPRLWGTFPRVLGRYARELSLLALPEAVRKMTSLPASRFGLQDRGVLRSGAFADMVLFDPETILDTATYAEPVSPAVGVHAVWVNGALGYATGTLAAGAATVRAGRFLPRDASRLADTMALPNG